MLHKLRIFMPSFPMWVMKSTKAQRNKLVVRTAKNITKIEIRNYLQSVYGLRVLKVNTLNVEGAKKRAKIRGVFTREPSYKKAYVTIDEADARVWDQFREA